NGNNGPSKATEVRKAHRTHEPAGAGQAGEGLVRVQRGRHGDRRTDRWEAARGPVELPQFTPGMWVFVKKIPSGLPAATIGRPSPCRPEAGPLSPARALKRPSPHRPPPSLGKPRGVLHPRVQQVGPDHFGIACFDCHKGSSKFLLADFYGRVLL